MSNSPAKQTSVKCVLVNDIILPLLPRCPEEQTYTVEELDRIDKEYQERKKVIINKYNDISTETPIRLLRSTAAPSTDWTNMLISDINCIIRASLQDNGDINRSSPQHIGNIIKRTAHFAIYYHMHAKNAQMPEHTFKKYIKLIWKSMKTHNII